MTFEQIAKVGYEVARTASIVLGDKPAKIAWDEIPEQLKNQYVSWVRLIYGNPKATAGYQHTLYIEQLKSRGWVYGKENDDKKKTTPLLVEYSELPVRVRIKDELFFTAVKELLTIG